MSTKFFANLFLFVLIFVFSKPLPATNIITACALLKSKGNPYGLESRLLRSLDLNKVRPNKIARLSPSVVRIDLENQLKLVLRPHYVHGNDTKFEHFAALFFNSAPGIATPEVSVRSLPIPLAKLIQPYFKPDSYQYLMIESMAPMIASVSLFYETTVGADYLLNEHNNFSLSNVPWRELPENLRVQLADHWAMHAVLAINDFHPYNWLINNGRVLTIDLAYRSREFDTGKISFESSHSPVREAVYVGSEFYDIISDISPDMRNFLRTVSAEQVQEIAETTEFSITKKQLEGIIARARFLLYSI
jgi:hypothetical protein